MRVPLSWLKDFVELPAGLTVEELAERLTTAGLEVSAIQYIGVPQQHPEGIVAPPSDHLVWDREKIVLGFIHEVHPHPNADRLVLAMVDHGTGELDQIVTGAPNLLGYKGQGTLNPPLLSPVAREGAEVYDGHSDVPGARMVLTEKPLRGIPNRHMVCSEMELGISGEHEGILLLPYDVYGHIAPGTALQDVLGDVVLHVEITPNMARCMSILGVAREVAALLEIPLSEPDYSLPEADGNAIQDYLAIEIRDPELNPRFTAAIIQNVEIKESPYWMQQRLRLVGQRPINNIVDVTNYVMFEIGQPTHAFDYDILKGRVGGGKPTIITRLAEAGETLVTLDGKDYALQPHNLLVADTEGALSMAGVMGGLESEVQDAAAHLLDATGVETEAGETVQGKASARPRGTETVLLEAAAWNLINIRQTLSSTKMHSEASGRFSRGVHPAMALRGLLRGVKLMAEVSGGTILPGILDVYPNQPAAPTIELPASEIERLLGFPIPLPEAAGILRRLGFEVVENGDALSATAPDHRLDIGTGVIGQADLIEDIARIYGYNRIPDTQISDALPIQRGNPTLDREERARDILAGAGLREVISYRLTTPEREAKLTPPNTRSDWGNAEYVTLANPISLDKTVMRQTLLSGLLEITALNARFQKRQNIFEIGNIYYQTDDLLPDEPARLCIVMTGAREVGGWQGADEAMQDFYDLKGVIQALLYGLRIEPAQIEIKPAEHSSFHPGRAAQLLIGGESVGVFGEVHPLVREAYGLGLDLSKPVLAAELDLAILLEAARPGHPVKPIPTAPAVYQDIALVVDKNTLNAEVERVIWEAGVDLLADVRLFDVYTGDPIPTGKKSLAYALTYQLTHETLTDKQVASVHAKIVKATEDVLGAKLRG